MKMDLHPDCPDCGPKPCVKHRRFAQMRQGAKQYGKAVPSLDWLEQHCPKDMVCPACSRQMNWERKDGPKTVLTLQHDRDGTLRIICASCNARHVRNPGDSFYALPQGSRRCSACGDVRPRDEFPGPRSPCRPCASARGSAWKKSNRSKVNDRDRSRYACRKEALKPLEDALRRAVALLEADGDRQSKDAIEGLLQRMARGRGNAVLAESCAKKS